MIVRFTVLGPPIPQGSKQGFVVTDRHNQPIQKHGRWLCNVVDVQRKPLKLWRKLVGIEAQRALRSARGGANGPPWDGPVAVEFIFRLPRAQNEYRANGQLKDWAPMYHTKTPDLTKITRGAEDALKGVLWADDSQVVLHSNEKRYVMPGEELGVDVRITLMQPMTYADFQRANRQPAAGPSQQSLAFGPESGGDHGQPAALWAAEAGRDHADGASAGG